MPHYRLFQIQGENNPLKGLWYARAISDETFDVTKLAQHMSDHNTPFSAGTIKGVLTDMINCIRELVLDGKNVKLENLAIFSLGIESNGGATSSEEFSVAKNVKRVRLRARATGDFSNEKINLDAVLREAPKYDGGATTGGTTEQQAA